MDVTGAASAIEITNDVRGIHVLLVDFDEKCLNQMASFLEKQAYKVTKTTEPSKALTFIRERKCRIDVVISEVLLPQMNGFTFLSAIFRITNDIPIIMMSSSRDVEGDQMIAKRAIEAGACFFFRKPIPDEDLAGVWKLVFCRRGQMTRNPELLEKNYQRKRSRDEDGLHYSGYKERLVWTPQLQKTFLDAINALGEDKARPKEIWNLMDMPDLTFHHVSSHFQRHKLKIEEAKNKAIKRTHVLQSLNTEPTPHVSSTMVRTLANTKSVPNASNDQNGETASRNKEVTTMVDQNLCSTVQRNLQEPKPEPGVGFDSMEEERDFEKFLNEVLVDGNGEDQEGNESTPECVEKPLADMDDDEIMKWIEALDLEELSKLFPL